MSGRLLIRVEPAPGESLIGYAHRLLVEHNYHETPRWALQLGDGVNSYNCRLNESGLLVTLLSELTGIDENVLKGHTLRAFDGLGGASRIRQRIWNLSIRQRYCPDCMSQTGIHRLLWFCLPIAVCVKHNRYLVDACPDCGKHTSIRSILGGRCPCGLDLGHVSPSIVVDARVAKAQGALLFALGVDLEGATNDFPQNAISTSGYFSLVAWLSYLVMQFPTDSFDVSRLRNLSKNNRQPKYVGPVESAKLCSLAHLLLDDWPGYWWKYLNEFRARYPLDHASPGIAKDFSRLYRILRRELDGDALELLWSGFLAFLRAEPDRYATEMVGRMDFSASPTQERQFSKKEAMETMRISRDKFRNLVALSGTKPVSKELPGRRLYVFHEEDVQRLEAFNAENSAHLTKKKAATLLGVSGAVVNELIETGLLSTQPGLNDAHAVDVLVSRSSYDAFCGEFLSWEGNGLSTPETGSELDWIGLAESAQMLVRHGITYGQLLSRIRQQGLPRRFDRSKIGLAQVMLRKADTVQWLDELREDKIRSMGYSLPEAQGLLNADVATIKLWIEKGLLEGIEVLHNGKRSYRVKLSAVEQFKGLYVLLPDVARQYGIHQNTVRGWVKRGLVSAATGPCVDGTTRYLLYRPDIESLARNPWVKTAARA